MRCIFERLRGIRRHGVPEGSDAVAQNPVKSRKLDKTGLSVSVFGLLQTQNGVARCN